MLLRVSRGQAPFAEARHNCLEAFPCQPRPGTFVWELPWVSRGAPLLFGRFLMSDNARHNWWRPGGGYHNCLGASPCQMRPVTIGGRPAQLIGSVFHVDRGRAQLVEARHNCLDASPCRPRPCTIGGGPAQLFGRFLHASRGQAQFAEASTIVWELPRVNQG